MKNIVFHINKMFVFVSVDACVVVSWKPHQVSECIRVSDRLSRRITSSYRRVDMKGTALWLL